jgi:N-methylhydantoinase A
VIKIGIDTGGTFTDLIAVDSESGSWFTAKVPSNPAEPLKAILAAVEQAGINLNDSASLVLGTTVGTNALLERKGARLAYITTAGFEDVPFIQRGNRKFHYDLHWIKPHPFVARADCLGVAERIDYRGRIDTPLQMAENFDLENELQRRISNDDLQAVAVSLLFSYLNPEHELMLGTWLEEKFPALAVSLSHQVAPVWREYERGLTTIADAYLKPLLADFIHSVDAGLREKGFKGKWALMKSNGGMRLAESAADEPVQLLLSGLAGGVMGGKIFGLPVANNLITLDIGGTSSDIAVISDGEQRYSMQYEVEFGLPLTLPTIDVTTIGAGGGSIAWIDGGGFMRVGPASAGAVPGPACYKQGGTEATVTDANLVLGRLNPDYFLGGQVQLETSLALDAVSKLGEKMGLNLAQTALAIINIANDNMMNAVRLRTVEVGIDPGGYSLVAFGGAGALHASALARLLGIQQVIIPPHPGLCSAFGALAADLRCDKVSTTAFRSDTVSSIELDRLLQRLSKESEAELIAQNYTGRIHLNAKLALRYQGQNYEHDIELPKGPVNDTVLQASYLKFNKLHDEFYGYNLSGEIIEIVNLTVTAIGASDVLLPAFVSREELSEISGRQVYYGDGKIFDTAVYRRHSLTIGQSLSGPAIIEEVDSTTLLEPEDALVVSDSGALIITIGHSG